MRLSLHLDGGYVSKCIEELGKSEGNIPKVDYGKIARWMSGRIHQDSRLLRTYYYDCLPYKPANPSEHDQKRYAGKQSFFHKLEMLDNFEVREGILKPRGYNKEGQPIFEQKRVDVLLATDMVSLALRNSVTHIGIMTGDSDFLPAIQIAKDSGIEVTLFYVEGIGEIGELLQKADRRIKVTKDVVCSDWKLERKVPVSG